MNERVTIEPGKRSGQPCVRGIRITVKDVLEYLAGGMSRQDYGVRQSDLVNQQQKVVCDWII